MRKVLKCIKENWFWVFGALVIVGSIGCLFMFYPEFYLWPVPGGLRN